MEFHPKSGKPENLVTFHHIIVMKYAMDLDWRIYIALSEERWSCQTSNFRGITLTSMAAYIYNALLVNRIQHDMEKILRRNQDGFRKGCPTIGQILTVRRIIKGIKARQVPVTLLFVDFSKGFESFHREKMEKTLLGYGIPKEIVTAMKILYRNTKLMVRSPDGDTEFFNILAGTLQGDALAPFLFVGYT